MPTDGWYKTLSTQVRLANDSDCRDIFEWRNDPMARRSFHNSDAIEWGTHQNWFSKAMRDRNKYLFICESVDKLLSVGVVRFEIEEGHVLISINLSPSFRGRGLGASCLIMAVTKFRKLSNCNLSIIAEILPNNHASRNAFEKAGFTQFQRLGNIDYYKLN